MERSVWSRALFLLLLGLEGCSCTPSAEEQREIDADVAEGSCTAATIAYTRAQGRVALGEWDDAAARDLEHISRQQEEEIRASLGREMGLAPSQVNGWRQIYRSRAETARREAQGRQQEIEQYRIEEDRACRESERFRSQRGVTPS